MEMRAERRKERRKSPKEYDNGSSSSCHSSSSHIDSIGSTMEDKRTLFQEKVRLSNEACQACDYPRAITLYTEAIKLDPTNHILFSNRSAAYVKIKQYEDALQDATRAKELNPKWAKAYYRQGVALQCLGRHADALAAFSSGLAQEPKSLQLLAGLIEAALKSPLKDTFEPTFEQLKSMKLDKSPFVIISVIGQDLLAAGYHASSLVVLESALKIGTCSLKLRGSVFSALSSAHWGLSNSDKAVNYMQQDLSIAKSLGDQEGECRAHGNLGSAYFSTRNFKDALTHHRFQLVLAMKLKDRSVAALALSSLGHVYTSIGDYPNALSSHKQCVLLTQQLNDKQFEARESGAVGAVYLALGDFENALDCHQKHLEIAKTLENKSEEARAYSNLGSAYHFNREFSRAMQYHNQVLVIAKELQDRTIEARAYAGLGHASRCLGDYTRAKECHEQQLNIALSTKDKTMEGRACSNLGIINQQQNHFENALKLHKAHLTIASELNDRAAMGRAFGNMGNAYSSLGQFEQAVKYHKQELAISKEVNDLGAAACTHGNLAVAYQSLGMHEKALEHYHLHWSLAQKLKDEPSIGRALSNLGNYHCSRGEFTHAIPFYEQYLAVCGKLKDYRGEGKACHNLGYSHYSMGDYKQAVQYYEQDLEIAKDLNDKISMGRAYCNLGLAYRTLKKFDEATECQKYFLTIAHLLKNANGKFRALGNLGDICMATSDTSGAIKFYEQHLILAKQVKNKTLEGNAYGALGSAYRKIGKYDKSLSYHTQELTIYQEISDVKGECKAQGHLGAVYMLLCKFSNAFNCYREQLERGQDLQDLSIQAQAFGNLGITKMNMNQFEEALGYFVEQLEMLQQLVGNTALGDRGRAFANMAECYEALGDYEEAVNNYDKYLLIAQKTNNAEEQDKAYLGLGTIHRTVGNLQQALFCFEKRLMVAHEMDTSTAKGSAYGELGFLHSLMGNFEQAISCLEHQLKLAKDMNDKAGEADAACGLGGIYQQMGEYEKAINFHQIDLEIAEETKNLACQGRAFGNLGVTNESLGKYQKAVMYQEQHLSIAAQVNDHVAKSLAYSSLGRIHHALGDYEKAVTYLQQGLQIADQLGRKEDEAKIRHRLGLALWSNKELEEAQHQLYRAADIFESIRREIQNGSEYHITLFDIQSACYQALQKVLVELKRTDEALVVAERGKTRAFIDLLLERQMEGADVMDTMLLTKDQILDAVNQQEAAVLYFSIAAGHLYSWLITPNKGIVKFHNCNVNDLELDNIADAADGEEMPANTAINLTTTTNFDHYIMHAREALGVDSPGNQSRTSDIASETESEADDLLQQHLDELSGKISVDGDKVAFLRMVNRGHRLNSSGHSLSSMMSQFSGSLGVNGTVVAHSKKRSWSGRPPLRVLYDILIGPMNEALVEAQTEDGGPSELVLVLEGDLHLVPFAVLKGSSPSRCLYQRFNLRVIPSLRSLSPKCITRGANNTNYTTPALVVANPIMPQVVTDRWGWGTLSNAEQEALVVCEQVGVKPLLGSSATKDAVLEAISGAECIHFATHVSWKLSALILSPGTNAFQEQNAKMTRNGLLLPERMDFNDSDDSDLENADLPALSDFVLSAADILDLQLTAKLVVLSAYGSDGRSGKINAEGLVGLARAFLAAGAQSVLVPLWPVPELATKIFMRSLYEALLRGLKTSNAVSEAMQKVQETKQFTHPSNWAGFMLIGNNIKISNKSTMFGNALADLLTTPAKCRESLRVLLHLIEKSLQRINRGHKNPMYTTKQSIIKKVGPVIGWQELLKSVGFRFEEPTNGLPPSVFFPMADAGDRLLQASTSLQALLGLTPTSVMALSKLLVHPEAAEEIIQMLRQVLDKYSRDRDSREIGIQVPINTKLWRTPGCHELLASLGFDLIDVGKEEVLLITGKQVSRRMLNYILQSLLAVFDPAQAPTSLPLERSPSMESLGSSHSGTSMSGLSGRSIGAMSGQSIISSHSITGTPPMPRKPAVERTVRSLKAKTAKRRLPIQTSTPMGTNLYNRMPLKSNNNPMLASATSFSSLPPKSITSLKTKNNLSPGALTNKINRNEPSVAPNIASLLYDVDDNNSHSSGGKLSSKGTLDVLPVRSPYSSKESLLSNGKSSKHIIGSVNLGFQSDEEEVLKPSSPAKSKQTVTRQSPIGSVGHKFIENESSSKSMKLRGSGDGVMSSSSPRRKGSRSSISSDSDSIVMKILKDTMPHMHAVDVMQHEGTRSKQPPLESVTADIETTFSTRASESLKSIAESKVSDVEYIDLGESVPVKNNPMTSLKKEENFRQISQKKTDLNQVKATSKKTDVPKGNVALKSKPISPYIKPNPPNGSNAVPVQYKSPPNYKEAINRNNSNVSSPRKGSIGPTSPQPPNYYLRRPSSAQSTNSSIYSSTSSIPSVIHVPPMNASPHNRRGSVDSADSAQSSTPSAPSPTCSNHSSGQSRKSSLSSSASPSSLILNGKPRMNGAPFKTVHSPRGKAVLHKETVLRSSQC
ncbi:tetratricopeptide repeat protein 28-like [Anneissia japonica]|uniref:tetratricopeptide repeat protein 28-like n=1 Tax=Anneissia japonica TaxID=1529436 RepID=UPI0014254F3D|nr:tetratricopeptide repeat protein 28-like [Anneissia japonica]